MSASLQYALMIKTSALDCWCWGLDVVQPLRLDAQVVSCHGNDFQLKLDTNSYSASSVANKWPANLTTGEKKSHCNESNGCEIQSPVGWI